MDWFYQICCQYPFVSLKNINSCEHIIVIVGIMLNLVAIKYYFCLFLTELSAGAFLTILGRTFCFGGIIENVSSTALDGIWFMVNNKETTCKRPGASFWFYIDSSSQITAKCQYNTWGFICLIYPVVKRGRDHTRGMKLLASHPFEKWTQCGYCVWNGCNSGM